MIISARICWSSRGTVRSCTRCFNSSFSCFTRRCGHCYSSLLLFTPLVRIQMIQLSSYSYIQYIYVN